MTIAEAEKAQLLGVGWEDAIFKRLIRWVSILSISMLYTNICKIMNITKMALRELRIWNSFVQQKVRSIPPSHIHNLPFFNIYAYFLFILPFLLFILFFYSLNLNHLSIYIVVNYSYELLSLSITYYMHHA